VQELIEKFSSLLREHSELKSDYLSERDNRRNYQSRVEEVHRAMSEHERQQVSYGAILYLANIYLVLLMFMFIARCPIICPRL
jgi:hypothetical protein